MKDIVRGLTFVLSVVGVCSFLGCSRGEAGDVSKKDGGENTDSTSVYFEVVPKSNPIYQTMDLTSSSSIEGTVVYDGPAPADSIIQLTADMSACNKPLEISNFSRDGNRLAQAVVFLLDVKIGKRLPLEKRYEIRKSGCSFEPRLQVVSRGGGVIFFSSDNVIDDASVVDLATGKVAMYLPFSDPGQVIPSIDLLDAPAAFEVSVDARPMSNAYMVVLDHPYYSITDKSGKFSIRDVPPGLYTLRAWHPKLGTVDKVIEVQRGKGLEELMISFPAKPLNQPK